MWAGYIYVYIYIYIYSGNQNHSKTNMLSLKEPSWPASGDLRPCFGPLSKSWTGGPEIGATGFFEITNEWVISKKKHDWLVVWNMNFCFSIQLGRIIPTDELHHFSEGRYTTNQMKSRHANININIIPYPNTSWEGTVDTPQSSYPSPTS